MEPPARVDLQPYPDVQLAAGRICAAGQPVRAGDTHPGPRAEDQPAFGRDLQIAVHQHLSHPAHLLKDHPAPAGPGHVHPQLPVLELKF